MFVNLVLQFPIAKNIAKNKKGFLFATKKSALFKVLPCPYAMHIKPLVLSLPHLAAIGGVPPGFPRRGSEALGSPFPRRRSEATPLAFALPRSGRTFIAFRAIKKVQGKVKKVGILPYLSPFPLQKAIEGGYLYLFCLKGKKENKVMHIWAPPIKHFVGDPKGGRTFLKSFQTGPCAMRMHALCAYYRTGMKNSFAMQETLALRAKPRMPLQRGMAIRRKGGEGELRKEDKSFSVREQKRLGSPPFWNVCFDKSRLKNFVSWFLHTFGEYKTVQLVEQLKNIGFQYATKAGISLGIDDLKIPPKKAALILEAEKITTVTVNQYKRAEITGVERFQRLIDTWHRTSEVLKQEVIDHFEATDLLNPVYMMAFSGARGNISQVRQLVGMRGLMADPQGQIIDFPIRSNFREGLTLTEYIISSYGARKGIVDTALRTANAGYLTRRLVDVAQHVIVSRYDCGTPRGLFLSEMKEGNKVIYSLQNRLIGRVLAKDIFSLKAGGTTNKASDSSLLTQNIGAPHAKEVGAINKKPLGVLEKKQKKLQYLLAARNQEITAPVAFEISKVANKVFVRSALTCETKNQVCQLCYGWSLSQGSLVSIGEAVGIVAAQSIGEPGTQLTMRTFHTGGVFSGDVSEQIRAPYDAIVQYSSSIAGTLIRTSEGKIAFLTKTEGILFVYPPSKVYKRGNPKLRSSYGGSLGGPHQWLQDVKKYKVPAYTLLFTRNGETVSEKQVIAQISSISRQKNIRDDAEFTLKAQLEGEFYTKTIDLQEKLVGPKLKPTAQLNYNVLDTILESWDWGFAWILSGKIYQLPIPSAFIPKKGDIVTKTSAMTETQWSLPSHGGVLSSLPFVPTSGGGPVGGRRGPLLPRSGSPRSGACALRILPDRSFISIGDNALSPEEMILPDRSFISYGDNALSPEEMILPDRTFIVNPETTRGASGPYGKNHLSFFSIPKKNLNKAHTKASVSVKKTLLFLKLKKIIYKKIGYVIFPSNLVGNRNRSYIAQFNNNVFQYDYFFNCNKGKHHVLEKKSDLMFLPTSINPAYNTFSSYKSELKKKSSNSSQRLLSAPVWVGPSPTKGSKVYKDPVWFAPFVRDSPPKGGIKATLLEQKEQKLYTLEGAKGAPLDATKGEKNYLPTRAFKKSRVLENISPIHTPTRSKKELSSIMYKEGVAPLKGAHSKVYKHDASLSGIQITRFLQWFPQQWQISTAGLLVFENIVTQCKQFFYKKGVVKNMKTKIKSSKSGLKRKLFSADIQLKLRGPHWFSLKKHKNSDLDGLNVLPLFSSTPPFTEGKTEVEGRAMVEGWVPHDIKALPLREGGHLFNRSVSTTRRGKKPLNFSLEQPLAAKKAEIILKVSNKPLHKSFHLPYQDRLFWIEQPLYKLRPNKSFSLETGLKRLEFIKRVFSLFDLCNRQQVIDRLQRPKSTGFLKIHRINTTTSLSLKKQDLREAHSAYYAHPLKGSARTGPEHAQSAYYRTGPCAKRMEPAGSYRTGAKKVLPGRVLNLILNSRHYSSIKTFVGGDTYGLYTLERKKHIKKAASTSLHSSIVPSSVLFNNSMLKTIIKKPFVFFIEKQQSPVRQEPAGSMRFAQGPGGPRPGEHGLLQSKCIPSSVYHCLTSTLACEQKKEKPYVFAFIKAKSSLPFVRFIEFLHVYKNSNIFISTFKRVAFPPSKVYTETIKKQGWKNSRVVRNFFYFKKPCNKIKWSLLQIILNFNSLFLCFTFCSNLGGGPVRGKGGALEKKEKGSPLGSPPQRPKGGKHLKK